MIVFPFAQDYSTSETDIDKLTAELVNVVNETMQPRSVSLWLKKTADDGRRTGENTR